MDILPFNDTVGFWEGSSTHLTIVVGIVGLFFLIGGIFLLLKTRFIEVSIPVVTFSCIILAVCFVLIISGNGRESEVDKQYEAYSESVSQEMQTQGFKIANGSLNLHPDTQSSLLIKYNGENYDCSAFSLKDVKEPVVFSCGPLKQSLSELATSNQSK